MFWKPLFHFCDKQSVLALQNAPSARPPSVRPAPSFSPLTPSSFATIDMVYKFTSNDQFTADRYIVYIFIYIFQFKSLRTLGWYVRAQGEAHCTLRSLCAGEGIRAFHHPPMTVYSFRASTIYKFTFFTFEVTHPGVWSYRTSEPFDLQGFITGMVLENPLIVKAVIREVEQRLWPHSWHLSCAE